VTADVMNAILVSGVTSQNKIIFHRFYRVVESNLDEMTDFSSETEVCTWAKYQRIAYSTIKQVSGFRSVSFYGGFSGGKASSRSYSNTSISPSVDNFKTFIGLRMIDSRLLRKDNLSSVIIGVVPH